MFSSRLWQLFLDSFPKILLPGLTATIPLTIISFSLALVIAVVGKCFIEGNAENLMIKHNKNHYYDYRQHTAQNHLASGQCQNGSRTK